MFIWNGTVGCLFVTGQIVNNGTISAAISNIARLLVVNTWHHIAATHFANQNGGGGGGYNIMVILVDGGTLIMGQLDMTLKHQTHL